MSVTTMSAFRGNHYNGAGGRPSGALDEDNDGPYVKVRRCLGLLITQKC